MFFFVHGKERANDVIFLDGSVCKISHFKMCFLLMGQNMDAVLVVDGSECERCAFLLTNPKNEAVVFVIWPKCGRCAFC